MPDTHRLCLMNLMLHGIESMVESGDTLSPDGERIGKADVIMTNPPFGTKKGGGRPTRSDFSVTADTSNKQLAFVEHIVRALKPGGRAAVVVPDNVLFEDNVGRRLRELDDGALQPSHDPAAADRHLLCPRRQDECAVPDSRQDGQGQHQSVWVYDMRANMNAFGKTRLLTVADFAPFEKAFGEDPYGKSKRTDEGEEGRFRCFSRDDIKTRNDSLDIAWLRDDEGMSEDQLTDPNDIAAAIIRHLKGALSEIETVSSELGNELGSSITEVKL